jgi:glycerol-3-phosphate acyltransferase PlsY
VNGFFSLLIGYGFGLINNAAIFSKFKRKNMREEGTGNIGATNAVIVLGRMYGVIILILDILKAYIAYKLAAFLFQNNIYGLFAGLGAMLGHTFPFYMRFKGGKGLAAFAGTVLARSPLMFLVILATVVVLLFIVNHSFIVPFAGTVLFSVIATLKAPEQMLAVGILTALMAVLIIWKHIPNFKKSIIGEDIGVRDYVKKYIFRHKNNEA